MAVAPIVRKFITLAKAKGLYEVTRTDVETVTGEKFPHNYWTINKLRAAAIKLNPEKWGPLDPDWVVRDRKIINAALLLARVHGANNINRQMIADKAGMAAGTVSNYGAEQPSKERRALALKLIKAHVAALLADERQLSSFAA